MIHKPDGKCKQGQPRMKWMKQVKENMKRIGLRKEDTADQSRWREDIAEVVRCIQPPPVNGV